MLLLVHAHLETDLIEAGQEAVVVGPSVESDGTARLFCLLQGERRPLDGQILVPEQAKSVVRNGREVVVEVVEAAEPSGLDGDNRRLDG